MPKYYVDFAKYANVVVEADSIDEAKEMAEKKVYGSFDFDFEGEWSCENVTEKDPDIEEMRIES